MLFFNFTFIYSLTLNEEYNDKDYKETYEVHKIEEKQLNNIGTFLKIDGPINSNIESLVFSEELDKVATSIKKIRDGVFVNQNHLSDFFLKLISKNIVSSQNNSSSLTKDEFEIDKYKDVLKIIEKDKNEKGIFKFIFDLGKDFVDYLIKNKIKTIEVKNVCDDYIDKNIKIYFCIEEVQKFIKLERGYFFF